MTIVLVSGERQLEACRRLGWTHISAQYTDELRHLFFEFAGLRSQVFFWGEWRSTGLAVVLPPAPGRKWLNDLTPQPAPPGLIELVKQPIKSVGGFSSFALLVATSDELPKAIYKALLRAMPLGSGLCRRHQRWAGSILRKLIAYRDSRNAALMRATFDFRSIIVDGLIAEADGPIASCDGLLSERLPWQSWNRSGQGDDFVGA